MTGEGTYTYASGDVYNGAFVDGKKHGQGSYLFKASQSTFMGRWENGAFVEGEWILRDGSSYKGFSSTRQTRGRGDLLVGEERHHAERIVGRGRGVHRRAHHRRSVTNVERRFPMAISGSRWMEIPRRMSSRSRRLVARATTSPSLSTTSTSRSRV